MVYRPTPELLKLLEALESRTWAGLVWRDMFADNPPTRANEKGARWNLGVFAAHHLAGNLVLDFTPCNPKLAVSEATRRSLGWVSSMPPAMQNRLRRWLGNNLS